MMSGECNCGEVAFEIKTQLSDVFVCHCSICRRSTGSGGIAVTIVDNKKFRWIKGEEHINYWVKPNHDWHTNFCKNCGSPLPGANDDVNMYIPVGTLTSGYETLKVAHHLFVNSKASWEEIGDLGRQHLEGIEE